LVKGKGPHLSRPFFCLKEPDEVFAEELWKPAFAGSGLERRRPRQLVF
jgi:hypothetical protein